jgi:hypothetical protein
MCESHSTSGRNPALGVSVRYGDGSTKIPLPIAKLVRALARLGTTEV